MLLGHSQRPAGNQALSPKESAAVRAHVLGCAQCSAQLAELRGDVALIGLSVDRHAVPVGARDRFLHRIGSDGVAAPGNLSNITAKKSTAKVVPISRTAWIPWTAAAVLAIASVLLGVKVNQLNTQMQNASAQIAQLSGASAKARQVLDVLTSRSAQHVLLTASKSEALPSGRAVYLADNGGLIFQASNLKQISTDKTYELWVIPTTGKPIPAGLFRPDANGSASVVLPPLPSGTPAKAFGVTIENAAGSDTPTAPLVMAGAPSTGE